MARQSVSELPLATLCFLVQGEPFEKILMGYKKRGFGKGKITGFGGKVEAGESVEKAAEREMFEETAARVCLDASAQVGVLNFIFPYRQAWSQQVHVFFAHAWVGAPLEKDEMIPRWYGLNEIPYEQMWQDGRYWLPELLKGRSIQADFEFADDNATVHSWCIQDHRFANARNG